MLADQLGEATRLQGLPCKPKPRTTWLTRLLQPALPCHSSPPLTELQRLLLHSRIALGSQPEAEGEAVSQHIHKLFGRHRVQAQHLVHEGRQLAPHRCLHLQKRLGAVWPLAWHRQ